MGCEFKKKKKKSLPAACDCQERSFIPWLFVSKQAVALSSCQDRIWNTENDVAMNLPTANQEPVFCDS